MLASGMLTFCSRPLTTHPPYTCIEKLTDAMENVWGDDTYVGKFPLMLMEVLATGFGG